MSFVSPAPINGMRPTPHHAASHVRWTGARVMPASGAHHLGGAKW